MGDRDIWGRPISPYATKEGIRKREAEANQALKDELAPGVPMTQRPDISELARYICRNFICAASCKECGYGSTALEHAKKIAALSPSSLSAAERRGIVEECIRAVEIEDEATVPATTAELHAMIFAGHEEVARAAIRTTKMNIIARLRSLSPPVEDGGWRTMESAPKDGTRVDLWCGPPGLSAGPGRTPDCWFSVNRWWRYDEKYGDDDCKIEVANATHWRPLPTPPFHPSQKDKGEQETSTVAPRQELSRLAQAIIDNTQGEMFWIGEILLSELEKETGFNGRQQTTAMGESK